MPTSNFLALWAPAPRIAFYDEGNLGKRTKVVAFIGPDSDALRGFCIGSYELKLGLDASCGIVVSLLGPVCTHRMNALPVHAWLPVNRSLP
jgi:hypothetical protein